MTSGLQEAAGAYGITWPFDLSVMGQFTSAVQTWDPASGAPVGYPAQSVVLETANGFKWMFSIVFDSASTGVVTSVGITHGNDLIWAASGTGTYAGQLSIGAIFSGDDTFVGNSFSNWFSGDGGNDTIDGGAGTDGMFFQEASTMFSVARSGSGLLLSGPYGTDTLINMERLSFSDESIAFDLNGPAGQAYRLYQAALDRAPDPGGLGYYIDKLEHGWSEHDIAIGFIHSPEFLSRFGTDLTDLQYIQQLYQNVLHREGEAAGVAYHLNALQTGQVDREQLLVNFSESPENQADLVGAMQDGMVYWPVLG